MEITKAMRNDVLRYIGIPSNIIIGGYDQKENNMETTIEHNEIHQDKIINIDKAKSRQRRRSEQLDFDLDEIYLDVNKAFSRLDTVSTPKIISKCINIEKTLGRVKLLNTPYEIVSNDIYKMLINCDRCYVLAATLGVGVDKEISLLQKQNMLQAMIFDASASVPIEKVCDDWEHELVDSLGENEYLTMRFSPGYGDVPLEVSNNILDILLADKKIGLTRTKSDMLFPTKSITAIIGISDRKENRHKSCANCNLVATCQYRRRGDSCGI